MFQTGITFNVHQSSPTMKAIHLLSAMLLCSICSRSQSISQGPFSASNFSTNLILGANATWNNITNAGASDNVYADFGNLTGPSGSFTNYLVATNFGFSIPSGAIINGIMVKVEQADPNSQTSDYRVRLIRKGSILLTDRAEIALLPNSDLTANYGSDNDLWGTAWAPKDFGADFGVAISMQRGATGLPTAGKIDNIQIVVYYTFITLPVDLTDFSARPRDGGNVINWVTADETAMDKYDLERSPDGRNFSLLSKITPKNLPGNSEYTFTDASPLKPVTFYRLHMTGAGGFDKYSTIVSVRAGGGSSFQLYPNPLNSGQNLHISNNGHEDLSITFFNLAGKTAGSITTDKDLFSVSFLNGQKGTFLYQVSDADHVVRQKGKIVIQ